MKIMPKVAGALGAAFLIGIILFWTRGNWGGMLNGTLEMLAKNVTGQEFNISVFDTASDTNDDAGTDWELK